VVDDVERGAWVIGAVGGEVDEADADRTLRLLRPCVRRGTAVSTRRRMVMFYATECVTVPV
jgi:hypothetical protein